MLNKNRHFLIIAISSLLFAAGCDDTKTWDGGVPREREIKVIYLDDDEQAEPGQSPSTLSKADVWPAVRENMSKFKECIRKQAKTGESVKGRMVVEFIVDASGRVLDVRISASKFKGTAVANCISKIIRQLRFPEFSGEPRTVSLPFQVL